MISRSGIFIEILDTSCCSWKRNNEEKNGVESCVANSWTFWEPIYFDQGFSLKFGAAMDVCRVERGIMRKMSCPRIRGPFGNWLWLLSGIFIEILNTRGNGYTSCWSWKIVCVWMSIWKRNNEKNEWRVACGFVDLLGTDYDHRQGFSLKFRIRGGAMNVYVGVERGIRRIACEFMDPLGSDYDHCQGFWLKFGYGDERLFVSEWYMKEKQWEKWLENRL